MKVSTISIDLAKNVFQVMGFTSTGETVFNKRLNRLQLSHFMQMRFIVAGLISFSWPDKF